MIAYKCDRCNKFYIDETIGKYHVCGESWQCLDLCQDCQNAVDDFMMKEGDKNAIKNN